MWTGAREEHTTDQLETKITEAMTANDWDRVAELESLLDELTDQAAAS